MSYVVRNGLLVPKRGIVRKRAHVRVPRSNIILRRVHWPDRQPIVSAVSLSNTGSEGTSTVAGTSFNYTGLNISNGLTNSAVVFSVILGGTVSTPTGLAATWNGVSCALLGSQTEVNSHSIVALFGLKSPASGTQTFALTWTNLADVLMAGVSFSGVDQTTPFQNANGSTSSSTISLAPSITTTSGNYTIGGFSAGSASTFVSSPGTSNSVFFDTTTLGGTLGVDGGMVINSSTSTSTTYTLTNSATDFAAVNGIDVKASSGAGPVTPSSTPRLLMGVGV
jgi:hypothetical protein